MRTAPASSGWTAPSASNVEWRTGSGTAAGSYIVLYGSGATNGGCGRMYAAWTNQGAPCCPSTYRSTSPVRNAASVCSALYVTGARGASDTGSYISRTSDGTS